jgi:hypothetical protein
LPEHQNLREARANEIDVRGHARLRGPLSAVGICDASSLDHKQR